VKANNVFRRWVRAAGWLAVALVPGVALLTLAARDANASSFFARLCGHFCAGPACAPADGPPCQEVGGTWYWLRSPEEEKRVVASLYNRYCVRCHGVDGRGVWDIPDVPDFTNAAWQQFHTDGQLARSIVEGRGAVMPPFRGTLSLEEAWAMARYLRTFVPGAESSRPEVGPAKKSAAKPPAPGPTQP
jgi:hypothetical protein